MELRYTGVALYSEQILPIPWLSVISRFHCRNNHDGCFPHSLMTEALFKCILRAGNDATGLV